VRLRLAGADAAWDLIAPATCELLDDPGVAGLLAGLGPDPLRQDADPKPRLDQPAGGTRRTGCGAA
jgi:hypothetical protein